MFPESLHSSYLSIPAPSIFIIIAYISILVHTTVTFKQVHFYSGKCTAPVYIFLFDVCGTAEIRPCVCITDYLKLLQNGTLQIRLFNIKWVQSNQGSYQTLKMSSATHREVTWTCLCMSSTKHILWCVRIYHEHIHTYISIHTTTKEKVKQHRFKNTINTEQN